MDNNKDHVYIQSVSLNDEKINRNYITHKEIMAGGELVFTMGRKPNENAKDAMAPSSKLYN